MKAIPEYDDAPVKYEGCTEGWAREFDPVVEKLESQAIGRQCYGEKNVRGKNITEFSIEEFSAIMADVMLRVVLYGGWRGLLKIHTTATDELQDTRTPVQLEDAVIDILAKICTKNQQLDWDRFGALHREYLSSLKAEKQVQNET